MSYYSIILFVEIQKLKNFVKLRIIWKLSTNQTEDYIMLSFKNVFAALDETRHFESVEHAVFDYQVNQTDSTFAYIFLEVYRIAASLQSKY